MQISTTSDQGEEMAKRPSPNKKNMEDNLKITFSNSVLDQLDQLVATAKPIITTDNGELFHSDSLPISVIKTKIPFDEYLDFIRAQDGDNKPRLIHLIPVKDRSFQIVVNAPLVIGNGEVEIEGRIVVLI